MNQQLIGIHTNRKELPRAVEKYGITTAQIFLGNPRSWALPETPSTINPDFFSIPVYAHSNYLINPASAREEVRNKTVKSLQHHINLAAAYGIKGVIVHGGQGGKDGTIPEAIQHWKNCIEQLDLRVPLLIENTAGGNAAPGRSIEGFTSLWEAVGDNNIGYCIDTCHAWTGQMKLEGLYENLIAAVGDGPTIIHLNGSDDEPGSGRDHHSNLKIDQLQTQLALEFARNSGAPCILETPGSGGVEDIKLLQQCLNN